MTKRKCPFCGSEVFDKIGSIEVEIIDDGKTLKDKIITANSDDEYFCAKCGKEITDLELD